MAKVKEKAKKEVSSEEKKAKREARMAALKNRPEGQRPNGKQIDTIDLGNGHIANTYGYAVVAKRQHIGVLTTTIITDAKGNPISVATAWVPGDVTVKAKKGHGIITGTKKKGEKAEEEEEAEEAEAPAKETKSKKAKKND